MAETFQWRHGLDERFPRAPAFYLVLLLSTGGEIPLNLVGIQPVAALFWSGVANGVLVPFLLFAMLAVGSDAEIMKGQPCPRALLAVVGLAAVASLGAALAVVLV